MSALAGLASAILADRWAPPAAVIAAARLRFLDDDEPLRSLVKEAAGPVAADPAMPATQPTGRADSSTDDPHPTP